MASKLAIEVRTSRLLLRRQHADDTALIKEAVDASLAELKASVAWARFAPTPLAELAVLFEETAIAFDNNTAWSYSIVDPDGTRVLGAVAIEPAEAALTPLVGTNAFEIGYWLRTDATGRGFATEATSRLCALAFRELNAKCVVICHDPANTASEGVPFRLGFRSIGVITNETLPGREAPDGSERPLTKVWLLDAKDAASLQ